MKFSPKTKTQIKPLPYPVYFWTVFILSLAGVADSVYLLISHYKVYTDIYYSSFCAISKSINCDTVSQSPYSIFLGLPLAVWGILAYTGFLSALIILAGKKSQSDRGWSTLVLISTAFCFHSIVLALISALIIHSYCMMCIVLYAINFLLLFFTWLTAKRFCTGNIIAGLLADFQFIKLNLNRCCLYTVPLVIITFTAFTFIPTYWEILPPVSNNHVKIGQTIDGYPWIGAENPKLTIEEFFDYQCFQCRKMHSYLRQLISRYPYKIRLIHRHFPMDREINPLVTDNYHAGSGKMAILSEYAKHHGKFWEMNDTLMLLIAKKTNKINLVKLAETVGLNDLGLQLSLTDKSIRYGVKHDISMGLKLGLNGTPGYLIDGVLYKGYLPASILNDLP